MFTIIKIALSKLRLTHFLVIALIALVAFSMWALGEIKFQKSEKNRQKDNYENLRDLDSVKTAFLEFRTTKELEDYIQTNQELANTLEAEKIKTRRIRSIITQKQKYIDSITQRMDVSGLVENIRKDIPAKAKWKDSTECLTVRGSVEYKNDSLSVNVDDRQFKNTNHIIGHIERKKWSFLGIKTRLFGKKRAVVTATSSCGDNETIIIEKKKR